jgi:hypothetical protein
VLIKRTSTRRNKVDTKSTLYYNPILLSYIAFLHYNLTLLRNITFIQTTFLIIGRMIKDQEKHRQFNEGE